ncbi:phenylacetate--CoA ligase family protein [Dokdonia sp. R78006]|uniref:phenylacetate--CoA ligase family protein n=1 Tax=Dokdonia sp. R78006 TaxID=3093866 RepID=UPI0036D353CA
MIDKIYKLSPYFVKVILLNIKAFLNERSRYTKGYYAYLKEYNALWKSDNTTVVNYQRERLTKLLLEVNEYVPYYKDSFNKVSISTEEIVNDPYAALKRLPFLSKIDRKTKVDDLINTNPERELVEVGYTSGTSGSPTVNYLDKESIERAFALWTRFQNTIGIKKNDKSIRFSGRILVKPTSSKPPFWVNNYIQNQLFMSTYHLTDKNALAYITKINKYKPVFMDGYPSAFYILAKFVEENNWKINFTPKGITTTAETLHDYQRVLIEKVFNCKVFNQYASSEGSPFITECVNGNLHVNEDSGVFEFLDKNDQPAGPNEIGRMVVTSFRNYKTPLVRYDIQDTVLMPSTDITCDCGCAMQIIDKIIGREDDLLWTREKGYVGRMDTAYKGLVGISKSQIIQEEVNLFIVKNVVSEEYTDAIEKKFRFNLEERLGTEVTVKMEYLNDIPLGKNGKFNAVIRNCKLPIDL